MERIPQHLRPLGWYPGHLAHLVSLGYSPHGLTAEDLAGVESARADLRGADLTRANLSGADLRGAYLSDANLIGANLTRADLSGAYLSGADLRGAYLSDANLIGADLRGAQMPTGIPVVAAIDAAILAAIDAPGCGLRMADWHTCETTHCRAGWAIHLAGEDGNRLELAVGPCVAGALIYAASGSHPVPNFFAADGDAMADLRARAARVE